MLTVQDRHVSNLEHARWRVAFRQSIYDSHLTFAHSNEEWVRKEQEYLQWLKRAKAELYRLEHPQSSPASSASRREVSTAKDSSSVSPAGATRDTVPSKR